MNKTDISVKMDDEGRLYCERPDGTLAPIEVPPLSPMSGEKVEASAAADPDNPPITPETSAASAHSAHKDLAPCPWPDTGRVCGAVSYPLGTLRDWEQGRTEPDQPTRAYLHVIAADPEGTRRALQILHS